MTGTKADRIHGYGTPGDPGHQKHHQRDPAHLAKRIERKMTGIGGGGISHPQRAAGMKLLVQADGKDQRRRDQYDRRAAERCGKIFFADPRADAGKKDDTAFIDAHTDELLTSYRAFKEKLSKLNKAEEGSDERAMIPDDELKDAYTALKEVIPQMDYDAVEMILSQVSEYKLSEHDEGIFRDLKKALQTFDWDTMETLMEDIT